GGAGPTGADEVLRWACEDQTAAEQRAGHLDRAPQLLTGGEVEARGRRLQRVIAGRLLVHEHGHRPVLGVADEEAGAHARTLGRPQDRPGRIDGTELEVGLGLVQREEYTLGLLRGRVPSGI